MVKTLVIRQTVGTIGQLGSWRIVTRKKSCNCEKLGNWAIGNIGEFVGIRKLEN